MLSMRPPKKQRIQSFKTILKIKYNNVLGYHLEVRKIHESKLLNNQLFIHRQSTAQAARFTTTELA